LNGLWEKSESSSDKKIKAGFRVKANILQNYPTNIGQASNFIRKEADGALE
jgi:hypothetical protein